MAGTRSNRLLLIGLAVFVVGAALVLLVTRGDSSTPAPTTAPSAAAAAGDDAVVTAPAEPVRAPASFTEVRIPRPLDLPEGTEALAVTMDFAGGVAALPSPGDRLNVYGVFRTTDADPATDSADASRPISPNVSLLVTNVEVLAVTGPMTESNGGNPTFILAVDAPTAERLIWAAAFERLHATLVRTDADAASTRGVDADSVLDGGTANFTDVGRDRETSTPAADTSAQG